MHKEFIEQNLKLKVKHCFNVLEKHPENIALQMQAIELAFKAIELADYSNKDLNNVI